MAIKKWLVVGWLGLALVLGGCVAGQATRQPATPADNPPDVVSPTAPRPPSATPATPRATVTAIAGSTDTPTATAAAATPAAEETVSGAVPSPAYPTPAPPPTGGSSQETGATGALSAVTEPLLIDGERGRIYASAQFNGRPATVVLSTADGRLLAAYELAGGLALDRTHNRLIVDRGPAGLAILDAGTGAVQATVELPPDTTDSAAGPQVDPATGLIYAFRDRNVYVVDPANGTVVRSVELTVPGLVCGEQRDAVPIIDSEYDLVSQTLYLSFATYACVPWIGASIIAYNPGTMVELGRYETDIRYQMVPFQGSLFGTTASRLGQVTSWAWNRDGVWFEEGLGQEAAPAGIVADWGRQLVYEALGERIRILDPATHAVLAEAPAPFPAGSGRLAGHDPISDNLIFLTGSGRLYVWPAANLFAEGEPPQPSPSALPETAVRALALVPGRPEGVVMAGLWDNGDCPVGGGRLFIRQGEADWQPAPIRGDGTCDALMDVALSPNYAGDQTLFVADDAANSILRSSDGGRSWQPAKGAFPAGTRFRGLSISPAFAQDQTLLAHTTAGEVYRSTDGGRSWQRLEPILDQLAPSPEFNQDRTLMGSAGGQLLVSFDLGETWQTAGSTPNGQPLSLLSLAPLFAKWQVAFAFTSGGELFRSLDGGQSWEYKVGTAAAPPTEIVFGTDAEENRPVFLLNGGDLLASFDGWDSTWSWSPNVSLPRGGVTSLAISPHYGREGLLYLGTADGQVIAVDASRP
jgi:photosystem II stability/assembly factor-like uncharacterized protein